ncbi:TPA: dynamin family protein [Vibrio cholerae]|nr:dynamin family protein [Vibrio cholerae]HCJ7280331.1 dynamin family protein [Vibrio cholerae]HCJ7316234.1 dynamin family protein [Vibrio cholerae]HDI3225590.1 dynamin family protein [Vibrio cholerae]
MVTSAELYRSYTETKKLLAEYPEMHQPFQNVEILFEDKKSSPDLSVMVYGIYNAGKSTLINALTGSEVAATGDIPLTDKITSYQWNNFCILDTPGIDAPLEHEQVTKAQMLKADVVVFVVNPSGAAEEEKTLTSIIDLIIEKKKLFLVFNEKNLLSQEDFIRLKNDTRKRLQILAVEKGVDSVLADIPIFRINAARALKGKLSMQQGLIEHSGITELESALEQFFASIGQGDVNQRLAHSLESFLNYFIKQLEDHESNRLVSRYKELCHKLIVNQNICRDNINQEILINRKNIESKSKASMYKNSENFMVEIEEYYKEAGRAVAGVMDDELNYLMTQFNDDVDTLAEKITLQQEGPNIKELSHCTNSESTVSNPESNIDTEALSKAAGSALKMAKPEHIVDGLKLVKDWAPSLMKGIGPKTMEKWAGQVISKWIPYAGAAVTVISSLYDLFSEDPADKKMREQTKKMQQERERFEREVEDTARDLAEQFERSMNQILRQELEPILQQMTQKVEAALDSASGQDKANRAAVMTAQTLLVTIK